MLCLGLLLMLPAGCGNGGSNSGTGIETGTDSHKAADSMTDMASETETDEDTTTETPSSRRTDSNTYAESGTGPATDADTGIQWPPQGDVEGLYLCAWSGNPQTYQERGIEHLVVRDVLNTVWSNNLNDIEGHVARTTAQPAGHRCMATTSIDRKMFKYDDPTRYRYQDFCIDPETGLETEFPCPWWDKGLTTAKGQMEEFIQRFHVAGGDLDVFQLDTEMYFEWRPNYLCRGGTKEPYQFDGRKWIEAIQDDPRWTEPDRYGYVLRDVVGTDDLYEDFCGDNYNWDVSHKWDWIVVRQRMIDYVNEAFYEPIAQFYPNVQGSNWDARYYSDEYPVPRDWPPNPTAYTVGFHFATHQMPVGLYTYRDYQHRNDYLSRAYPGLLPFNTLLVNYNNLISTRLSKPSVPVSAWLEYADPAWTQPDVGFEIWKENTFHALLGGLSASNISTLTAGMNAVATSFILIRIAQAPLLYQTHPRTAKQGVRPSATISSWNKRSPRRHNSSASTFSGSRSTNTTPATTTVISCPACGLGTTRFGGSRYKSRRANPSKT